MNVFELFGTIAIDHSQASSALAKVGNNAKATGKAIQDAFSKIGTASVKVGKVVAGAGAAVGGAWVAAIEGTRDYRTAMAKLDTAFVTNGHSAETAKKTYQDLQSVLGETDVAVEAANHLAVMCKNEEELEKWTSICTGVFATFGDSLPIEGLTESANETAKVGQVTGSLADALNWAGISEEDFNTKLRACRTEQERQKLIVNHLMHAYKGASEQYQATAEDIIKANRAQESWNSAMAALGKIGEPILTSIKQKTADMVLAAVPHLENFITKFKEIDNVWTDVIWPLMQSTFKVAFGIELPEWSEVEKNVSTWWTETAKPALEQKFKIPFDIEPPAWSEIPNSFQTWWTNTAKPKIEEYTQVAMKIKLPDFAGLAESFDFDWKKLVVPTLTGLLTGNMLTITPVIGMGLAGLIASNWDTHIAPVLGGFLNQDLAITPPDFEALAATITSGWDTYVSPDVKEMFSTLGSGLSDALGTGGEILTNVVTGIKEFGTWCVDNKETINEFFGIMGEEAGKGAEGAVGGLGLLMQSLRGLADLSINVATDSLKWMFEHGEATAKIIETLAVAFAVGAIAAHPYAAAIMAVVGGLGLLQDRKTQLETGSVFSKYSEEDLALLQKWVDTEKEVAEARVEGAQKGIHYLDNTEMQEAIALAEQYKAELDKIDGLQHDYMDYNRMHGGDDDQGIWIDVPMRSAEGTEEILQTDLDGMALESDVTMNADMSNIQPALNRAGFTAFASIMPTLGSYFGGTSTVKWNADGAVFDRPTIFNTHRGFQGVGEAGPEAVAPIGVLQKYVSEAVANQNAGMVSVLQNMLTTLNQISANTSAGHQVVLDSGVMVGQMTPKMDMQLGTLSTRKGRRN